MLIMLYGCGETSTNSAALPALSVPQGNTVRISPEGSSYADPEILNNGENKVTFQDRADRIWLADLDPVTGDFVSATGEDILLGTDAGSLLDTFNGPEFGRDMQGWSVFYSKITDSVIQIWRAEVSDTDVVSTQQMTSGNSHMTAIPQQSDRLNSTRILHINGDWDNGMVAWFDDDNPADEINITAVDTRATTHPTWVEDTDQVILSLREGDNIGQLAFYNIQTGEFTRITDDAGNKTFPFAWSAPEFGNELIAMALVDKTSIGIYQDNGGALWDRISTLTIPDSSNGITLGSAEPFIAMGKSYLSLSIQLNNSSTPGIADAQVWIFGIEDDPATRFTYRCDDKNPSLSMRMDPEIFIGSEQAFVYYNIFTTNPNFEAYRCATGIRTN